MVKLKQQEVEEQIRLEDERDINIPRDAKSEFQFEIEENSAEILINLEKLAKKFAPQQRLIDEESGEVDFTEKESITPWNYVKRDDGEIWLQNKNFAQSFAVIKKQENGIDITTAFGGYKYSIKDKKDGIGAKVTYNGPVNGLMNQMLLPKMTYVLGTLEARFLNAETGHPITSFMDMDHYGFLREAKNQETLKKYKYGEKGNAQDNYGYQINAKFNNELNFMPKSENLGKTVQQIKNDGAQRDFEEGYKVNVSDEKRKVEKSINKLRKIFAEKGGVSGVVVADRIAEQKISSNLAKRERD